MATIMELMLSIRYQSPAYYHRDTNQIDFCPMSEIELKNMDKIDWDARVSDKNRNLFVLPTYEEIDHKEIMRFFVREFVEDKAMRKQLFDILRRDEFMDAYLDKLKELELYEDFEDTCGDIYIQIFREWCDKNNLNLIEK